MNGGQYYQKLWLEMGPRCESKLLKWDLVVGLIVQMMIIMMMIKYSVYVLFRS